MKCKLNTIFTWISVSYFISLCFGSALFLGLPSFSLMNLLFPLSFSVNIYGLFGKTPKKVLCSSTIYLVFIIGSVFPFLLLQPSEDQIKDFLYLMHLFNLILLSVNFSKNQLVYVGAIKLIFFSWTVLAFFQFAFIIGFLPSFFDFLFFQKTDSVTFYQVNGIFANSNDFSCIIFLFYFMIVYYDDKSFSRYSWVTAVVLILSLSRISILVFIIFLLFKKMINGQHFSKILKNAFLFFLLTGIVLFTKIDFIEYSDPNFDFVTRNLNRLISIVNIAQEGFENDNSSSMRIDSYLYALKNLPFHIAGTGAKNYTSFYDNSTSELGLLKENPHSFIIEIGISYGIFAVLVFNILFGYLLFAQKRNLTTVEVQLFVFLLFTTMVFSNIPSSVIRLPVLWMPLFFLFVSNKKMKKFSWDEYGLE